MPSRAARNRARPGLGWVHRDNPHRDSAALDLLEAIRPDVDLFILRLLHERTFARREFAEVRSGQVRLSAGLAKQIAGSVLSLCEAAVAPVGEELAKLVASSPHQA